MRQEWTVKYMDNSGNIVKGFFNVKELLFEKKLKKEDVVWQYQGEEINLNDRAGLKAIQKKCLEHKDYPAVKQINDILLELNYSEKKVELDSYPVNLQIEHTNFCNARCIMCSHCFTKNHGGVFLSDENLKFLNEVLPYVRKITLHGYGEPFMHPNIIQILNNYAEYGIKITCNTNASIMSSELAAVIHKCFYDISISCDGATAYTYERVRVGLDFEKFKSNVRMLRNQGDDLFMRMAVVVMRQNIEELPQIVEMASELGFQEVLFVDITTQSLLENEEDSPILYPSATYHFIREAEKIGKEKGINVKVPKYIMDMDSDSDVEADLKKMRGKPFFKDTSFTEGLYNRYKASGFIETTMPATKENFVVPGDYRCEGICDFVLERPFINANGDVFLCCTNWMHIVGNVYKDGGFEAVWNGEIMQGIRRMFYEGNLPKYCTGCIFVRNDIMCSRLKVSDLNEEFYKNSYEAIVDQMIQDAESKRK